MGAVKRTTLYDLAMNFDKYMFDRTILGKRIAKGFTVDSPSMPFGLVTKTLYWEILGVRQDGTYPCVADYIRYFDQNSNVTIHHIDNL